MTMMKMMTRNFANDFPGQSFTVAREFEQMKAKLMYNDESEKAAESRAMLKIYQNYRGVQPSSGDYDTESTKVQRFLRELDTFSKKNPAAAKFGEEIYAKMEVYNMSMKNAFKEVTKKHKAELLEEGYE